MSYGNKSNLGQLEHDTSYSIHQAICKIDDTHSLLAYNNGVDDGVLKVITLSENLVPYDTIGQSAPAGWVTYETTKAYYNALKHLTGEYYVLVWQGGSDYGNIQIVQVNALYVISLVGTNQVFHSGICDDIELLILDSSHVFLAWSGLYSSAWFHIKTMSVVTGTGVFSSIDSDSFDTEAGIANATMGGIAQLDDEKIVLSYQIQTTNPIYTTYFREVWIGGTFYFQVHSRYTVLTGSIINHEVEAINSDYFVFAWHDHVAGNGELEVFSLIGTSSSTPLTFLSVDSAQFTTTNAYGLRMMPLKYGYFLLSYGYSASYTGYRTFQVDYGNNLVNISTATVSNATGYAISDVDVISLTDNYYMLAYSGADTDGFLRTIDSDGFGTGTQINIGDVWKDVELGQVNISDTWRTIESAWINIGDEWRPFW